MTIKAGQIVKFRPEFMDPGDENITFVAINNEAQGRVTVKALVNLPFQPTQVVLTHMIATDDPR